MCNVFTEYIFRNQSSIKHSSVHDFNPTECYILALQWSRVLKCINKSRAFYSTFIEERRHELTCFAFIITSGEVSLFISYNRNRQNIDISKTKLQESLRIPVFITLLIDYANHFDIVMLYTKRCMGVGTGGTGGTCPPPSCNNFAKQNFQ